MVSGNDLKEISPQGIPTSVTAAHVQDGIPIPKIMRVKIFSPEEWEAFTEEWAMSLVGEYKKIRRFGGAGDMGIDVIAFCTDAGFGGAWDNYQCKRYDHPLRPGDIWVEIGKIIYYSSIGEYPAPRKYYFVGSQGIGTSLEKLLNDPAKLKAQCQANWAKNCETGITSVKNVPLEGTLLTYFDAFNFSIFSSKSPTELISGHATTTFHSTRFGGGLPPRPLPDAPPEQLGNHESRYVRQLLDAYGEQAGIVFADIGKLQDNDLLHRDFQRQRERFYHAEALRNFARDTVPEGTFDALQDEIFHGVVDVTEGNHANGYARMKATIVQAAQITSTSNPLAPATKIPDRQGICHQLANDDRLQWILNNG